MSNDQIMCRTCAGDKFQLLYCCNGACCGCMPQPVDVKPCPVCNVDGLIPPDLDLATDFPWFFLPREALDVLKTRSKA